MNIYMIEINHTVGSDYEGMELKYTVAVSMTSAVCRAENYIARQYGSMDYSEIIKVEQLAALNDSEVSALRQEIM